jgi:hypothetical protein
MDAPHILASLMEMYQLDAAAFVKATEILHALVAKVEVWSGTIQASPVTAANAESSSAMLAKFNLALGPLNVPVTKLAVSEAQEALENAVTAKLKFHECGQLFMGVATTLRRELMTAKVYVLDARRADFYSPAEPLFGVEVHAKFPSIAGEIEEAGKCYACDLPTAFAFHTIRSLEAGVRAVARCLGIPDPTMGKDRNWSNISRSIKDKLDAKWPASTGRMSGDGHDFDKIYGALVGMQNPYRNETMHLSAVYSATEALHIFEVVKGLMQRIAARTDEQGLPLA